MPVGALRMIIALAFLTVLVIFASYYFLAYLPGQARKPYVEAGLSVEQADSFIKNYPQQNGNSTWVSFALNAYGSKASEFVNFAESNNYDGVNLKIFPSLRRIIAKYCLLTLRIQLVKTVHDQFLRDEG
ncbi:MAG: hypothetical protein QXM98_06845 [Thermoproteota archaeon]